jgi:aspartate/methionine/tyrosine aminotransferase
MICANPRCEHIKYAIRDIIAPAEELEKQGKKILKLNIGDPDQFDFDTPDFIKDACLETQLRLERKDSRELTLILTRLLLQMVFLRG